MTVACAAPLAAQTATVTYTDVKQQIDGFGASDAFLDTTSLTEAQADKYFSQQSGIGLSMLRVGIDTTGANMGNWATARQAVKRGAKLVAVPWSAAAVQKDNASTTNGGHLLTASRGAWGDTMAGFQATAKTQTGANLYAVIVQNEPDFTATYDSMLYTTAEMTAFVKVLGPKLAALTPAPKLLLPELSDWSGTWTYTADTLGDGTAAPYVSGVSAHQYNGVSAPSGIGALHVWQTEMSGFDTFDATITQALTTAQWVNDALTTGDANAWFWWWIMRSTQADNEGLDDVTTPTKRVYTLGNYSKFVRPGAFRVGVTTASVPAGMSIAAFRAANDAQVTMVVINNSGGSVTLTTTLAGFTPPTMTPYVTSSSQNLAALAPITVSAGAFAATMADQTVTTFVGQVATKMRSPLR